MSIIILRHHLFILVLVAATRWTFHRVLLARTRRWLLSIFQSPTASTFHPLGFPSICLCHCQCPCKAMTELLLSHSILPRAREKLPNFLARQWLKCGHLKQQDIWSKTKPLGRISSLCQSAFDSINRILIFQFQNSLFLCKHQANYWCWTQTIVWSSAHCVCGLKF